MKGRIINFRSFLWIALSVIVSVLGIRFFYISRMGGVIVLFVVLAVLIGAFVWYSSRPEPLYKRLSFIVAILLSAAAVVSFSLTIKNTRYVNEETVFLISGKADEVNFEKGRIVLKDLRLNGTEENGKILLEIDFESYRELFALKIGDVIIFEAKLNPNRILSEDGNRMNAYAFRSGIKYHCYEFASESETVALEKAEADFFDKINVAIQETLILAMGSDHGGVAYGLFTGDKSGISEEIQSAYSVSGMGHILAVSGLHVGFMSVAVLFILKCFRIRKRPAGFIATAVLWFYAFFTGFTPSVLRAVIMATVMMLSRMFSRRYDALSSLSLAVTVILAVFPIYLFDVGFLLSVTAVLGIVLFLKPIQNALIAIKMPKFAARTVAMTVAVQIGFLPSMIFGFNGIYTYAILLNVLILPFVGLTFSTVLIGLLLTALFRPLIFVLQIAGGMMAFVDTAVLSAAGLPFSTIYIAPMIGGAIFFSYLLFFFASRFIIWPKGKHKKIVTLFAMVTALCLCFSGIFTAPRYEGNAFLTPIHSFGDVTTVVRHNNRTYVIGDLNDFRALERTLLTLRIDKVDAIFLSSLSEKAARSIVRFSYAYRAGLIFAYESGDLSGIRLLAENGITNFVVFDGNVTLADDIAPIVRDGKHFGYLLSTDKGGILFCGYRTNYSKIPIDAIDNCFAVRSFMYQDLYPDRIYLTNMEKGFKGMEIPSYQYSNQDDGRYIFDFENGRYYQLPEK